MNASLTHEELVELTGYQIRARQLRELHRQGFHRARINPAGKLVVERAHYEAVCTGQAGAGAREQRRPRVGPP